MKKFVIILLLLTMVIFCGCETEGEKLDKTVYENMTNIEKAEYYIEKADRSLTWKEACVWTNMAEYYLLKEAVEKGLTIIVD